MGRNITNCIIVARNPGITKRASSYADRLSIRMVVIHGKSSEVEEPNLAEDGRSSPPLTNQFSCSPKERLVTYTNVISKKSAPLSLVGSVKDMIAIIIDDNLDEVDSLITVAHFLIENGASRVLVVATHGIMSSDTPEKLMASPIEEVIVTNSVPQDKHLEKCSKIKVVDVSILLAEAIRRIHHGESMSYLFRNVPVED